MIRNFFNTVISGAFLVLIMLQICSPRFARGAQSGKIIGWGNQVAGVDLDRGFKDIAAGENHSLGLKHNGSIVAWGVNWEGQCNIPLPNTGFVAVAAGGKHSLGLKHDGSVVAWGWNYYGQCDVPSPNTGFVAVAAGYYHSLGLKSDGSIVAWGDNYDGECNVPLPNIGFVAIATGTSHSLGLKSDGSIVAWGYNFSGQCNIPSPNTDFVAIAAGASHSLGLKSDGSIVAWGYNFSGQCDVPSPNTGFAAIAAGGLHGLGVKDNGSIVAWGDNSCGECNIPSPNTDFVAVATGWGHSLGLKRDGSIITWGNNSQWQCNIPSPNNDFIGVAMGGMHYLGLKQDGSIVGWGYNYYGQATPPAGNDFVAIATGLNHSLGLKQDGSIVTFGDNSYGQCDVPLPNTGFTAIAANSGYSLGLKSDGSILSWGGNFNFTPGNDLVAISAGYMHILGLREDGSIVGWGDNSYGQCSVPLPNTDFVAIAAGSLHSLGLKRDGSIVAFGDNYWGDECNVPSPNTGFIAIAAGGNYSLGLKQDGSVVAWGATYSVPSPNVGFIAIAASMVQAGPCLGIKQVVCPNEPMEVNIVWPLSDTNLAGEVTLMTDVNDNNNVAQVYFYLREPNSGNGVPIDYEDLAANLNSLTGEWEYDFNTTTVANGEYMLLAKAEDECGNASYGEPVTVTLSNQLPSQSNFLKFGNFDDLKNVKATLKDCDGNNVTFSLSGGGYGLIDPCDCSFGRIELYDTTDKSVLTISTIGKTWTSIGSVICQGPLKGITAKTADLGGDITIAGSLGALTLHNVADNHTITIGFSSNPKAGVLMKFDQIKDLTINSDMPIKMLLATEWLDTDGVSDELNAPSVGSLIINGNKKVGLAGDFEADLNIGKGVGANLTEPVLKNAKIAGTLTGESVIHGNVGTAMINILQGWLNVEGDAKSIKVNHALVTVDYPEDTGSKLIVDGKASITAGKDKIKVQEGAELYGSQDANLYRFEDLRRYDQLGAWWTYNGTYTVKTSGENPYSDTTEMTTSVADSTTSINGHDCYIVTSYVGDQDFSMAWYTDTGGTHLAALDIISDYGVEFELDIDTTIIAPSYLRMRETFKNTGSFTGDFSAFGDITGTIYEGVTTASMTLLGHEEVTVPEDIGTTYLAAKIDTAVYLKGNMDIEYMGYTFPSSITCSQKVTLWGVPGVGIVKSQLKDFSFVISIHGESAATVKVKEVDELLDYGP